MRQRFLRCPQGDTLRRVCGQEEKACFLNLDTLETLDRLAAP